MVDVVRVFRVEFEQAPGKRTRWLGPHTSSWMSERGEELATFLEAEHRVTRPHPVNSTVFAADPVDRYVCACDSEAALREWFGHFFEPLRAEGGHLAVYDVPVAAIAEHVGVQVVFQLRRATLVERTGTPAPTPPGRSCAGSRQAKIAAAGGRYDHDPHRVNPALLAVFGE